MEVEANLRSRGVYLSGERLHCEMTFTNVGRLKSRTLSDVAEGGQRYILIIKHTYNNDKYGPLRPPR